MSEPGELALLGSAKDGAVRTTSRGENKAAKWLVIASGKGGSGKTTASLNMAVYAAHEGLRVVVVDLDRQATLTRWYQRRPDEAPAVILWAGSMSDAAKAIREIDALEGVDLVVVDTPPGLDDHPEATRLLVEKADFVLVPVMPDRSSAVEAMRMVKQVRSFGRASKREIPLRAVRSRWNPKGLVERAVDADLAEAGVPVLGQYLSDLSDFGKLSLSGKVPLSGKVSLQTGKIIDELVELGALPARPTRKAA